MRSKVIKVDVYNCSVRAHIVKKEDLAQVKKEYNLQQDIDELEENDGFVLEWRNGARVAVIIREDFPLVDVVGTISHEVVHLVNIIFKRKMISPDVNNDEPQAYLQGFLTEQIFKLYQDGKKV